jgi:rubredoxin
MTDPNPEYDPEDIRGAARSDPASETEAVSDGDSVAGNYPTHADGRERANTCATCWQQIPKGRIQCPHCASNNISESSRSDRDRTVQEWSFGRVVVAVVPGNSTYHARALGASAFAVSDSVATGPDVSHGEVKPRAAFDTAPASHLTDGWPDLPPEAPVDEPDGTTLFETAVEETDLDGDGEPRIYREDGHPVTTRGELDLLEEEIEAADEQYWVVPGIVQRYEATPDLSDIDEQLYCIDCGESTGHEAVGRDSIAPYPHRGRPMWACKTCGQPRHEPVDKGFGTETYTQFDLPFEGPPASSLVRPDIRE